MLRHLWRGFTLLEKSCFAISTLSAAVIMVVVSCDSLARYFLKTPIMGAEEFVDEYVMVILVFLAMSTTYREGHVVKVEILESVLPIGLKKILSPVLLLISLATFLVITNASWHSFVRAIRETERSVGSIPYLLAPAYFFVPLGTLLLCVRIAEDIFKPPAPKEQQKP